MGFVVCYAGDAPAVFCVRQTDGGSVDFWQVLPVALALVFIIEGVMPFLSPRRWREVIATVAGLDDRAIRYVGLVSMLIGLGLLYWVH